MFKLKTKNMALKILDFRFGFEFWDFTFEMYLHIQILHVLGRGLDELFVLRHAQD
jgi:hypothetical protein